jgi:hypothetical protein
MRLESNETNEICDKFHLFRYFCFLPPLFCSINHTFNRGISMTRGSLHLLFIALLGLSLILSGSSAQSASLIEKILDRYTQALGGEAKVRGIVSIVAQGGFYLPESGTRGMVRQALKAPNKSIFTIRSEDKEIFIELGFDGKTAWQQRLYLGGGAEVTPITGQALAQIKLNAHLYREFKLRELYPRMQYQGRATVAGRLAYVIDAFPSNGKRETWYFDGQTALLARRDTWSVSPSEQSQPVQNLFSDYREVSGIKIPHEIKILFPESPESNIYITLTEIATNTPVSDLRFIMPEW